MGTDTFGFNGDEETPPPRLIGHQTLFELVAKGDCTICKFSRYCTYVNSICRTLSKVNLWEELKE